MADTVESLLIAMELLRVIPILLYYKYPQAMRAMFAVDAMMRILQAFLPIDSNAQKRIFLCNIALDCILNYCGDFQANIIILNIQSAAIMIITGFVFSMRPIDAFIDKLLSIVLYNIIFLGVAAFLGR